MTESECLKRMKAPGDKRKGKWLNGCIQILVTHSCDKSCFGCTQGSQLRAARWEMTVDHFRTACLSVKDYFGVVGMFGGNPALHSRFDELCEVMREIIPFERRGLWCNNPMSVDRAKEMSKTFNPRHSNLNVHLDAHAYQLFKEGWPACEPVGLHEDSRHSPPWVAMKDVEPDEDARWDAIATCDINQHWSAGIGPFRGELRAWFCEIAMAQAIRHQHEEDYPDTGLAIDKDGLTHHVWIELTSSKLETIRSETVPWWQLSMTGFADQVRKHCHDCGVPMRGYGELAMSPDGKEQVSATHEAIFKPKRASRAVELVTVREQLGRPLARVTNYLGNAKV